MVEFTKLFNTLKNAVLSNKSLQYYKPGSLNRAIKYLKLLYHEGFILNYIYDTNLKHFIIYLNYIEGKNLLVMLKIFNVKRAPKYITYKDLCTFNNNCTGGLLIISNSQFGILTHYKALKLQQGGRLLCLIR